MTRGDRSGVVRMADACAAIPGPAGEHAVGFLREIRA
jgi:hypothetical protein